MGRESYKALTFALFCLLAACVKDKPQGPDNNVPKDKRSVYIVCEGNFGTGDGSLFLYAPLRDSVYGDLYKVANNQELGDVFQSMVRIGDEYFLCINNSDKVVVVNAADRKFVTAINIPKPRYILPVSATKTYISTLYSNRVFIINPQTKQVTGTIEMPGKNPEGMCLYNGDAIVCTWDTAGNAIFKVDAVTDKVKQTITVAGYAPQEALLDKEQMLWVLSGNKSKGKTAAWTRVDPSTGLILKSYLFPKDADVIKPVFNSTRDTIYFIEVNYSGGASNNGIFRMGIYEAALPEQAFIAAKQYQYFWALGIEPATGYIYAGDARGFIQKGGVSIHRPDGSTVTSFNVGVGPGHFYFD
jgi:YVTN family beta-propeller protein